MRSMLTLMIERVHEFNAFIQKDIAAKSNTNSLEYQMLDLMMRLTNDIIGSTAFGIELNSLKSENEFYRMGKEIAYAIMSARTLFVMAFPKLSRWLNFKILTDKQDQFFRNVIHDTIKQREEQKIVRNDMIHLMLLAKEGRLNDEKDNEADQNTGFATISDGMLTRTTEKLKSNSFANESHNTIL